MQVGKFLILLGESGDADLGSHTVQRENLSRIWKKALTRGLEGDRENLLSRLVVAGLRKKHLLSAVRQWSRPSSSVIHSPRTQQDFQILLEVLQQGRDDDRSSYDFDNKFVATAWNEIRMSRGEAIQFGTQEHSLVEEQKIEILKARISPIKNLLGGHNTLDFEIPDGYGVSGTINFREINYVDQVVSVHQSEIGRLREFSDYDLAGECQL